MPSLIHEAMIEMVRQRPAVVAELLAGPMKLEIPVFDEAVLLSNDLTDVVPAEFRADAVVAFKRTASAQRPALAVVFEAQRGKDRRKRLSWPVYVATAHARLDCPTALFVWCENRSVATWAAEPISTGHPGLVLTPVVVGPDQIPVVTSFEEARRNPELTVLSALSHGPGSNPEPVLEALVAVLDKFDPEHATLYAHLVATVLPAAARSFLEKMMKSSLKISLEEFGRTVLPDTYAELTAKGKAEGKADAVLTVLETKGIAVPDEVRQRIATCTDIDQLDIWIRRSATAVELDELFA